MSTADQSHSESLPGEELQQIGNGQTDNFDNEGSDFSLVASLILASHKEIFYSYKVFWAF